MNTPLNMADILADRITTRGINLLRYDAHLRRRIVAKLKRLEKELVAEIAAHDPFAPTRTATQQARLDALLRQTRSTIATAYRGMRRETETELRELALDEHALTSRIYNRAVGVDLFTASVSDTQLKAVVNQTLIKGTPMHEWWDRQSKRLQQNFADEMGQGYLRGETVDQLTRRVVGELPRDAAGKVIRSAAREGGIMQTSRAHAESLVRTAVNGISNGARMATFEANAEVVRGIAPLVTLDGRTSLVCISRSKCAWTLDGDPLPESDPQIRFPGYPPWHFGERTSIIAVLRPVSELLGVTGTRKAAQLDRLPAATQASMDGQVAASLSYLDWLESKPVAFQREVLGAGRYELWKAGQIDVEDMIDQSGRPRSLEQLRKAA